MTDYYFIYKNITTFFNFRRKVKSVIYNPNKLCTKLIANIRKNMSLLAFFSPI
jgi:hypothetical protein